MPLSGRGRRDGGSNDVAVIDLQALRVASFVPVGIRPWGLNITSDGKKRYVANGVWETISVIDTESQKVVAAIPVGKGPWGVAVGR
jgi:YVTN family beta-propeller protein